jgi:Uma2 family endonuclease
MATRIDAPVSLESGDHLTREEFHRRYLANPRIKKAELVEGVVYVPSPVRARLHGKPHGAIVGWLYAYTALNPDVVMYDNATVYLEGHNEMQPDACLGREGSDSPRMSEDGYIVGAPQFVVEVAASSASYDLHEKKEAYRRNGVPEYVVWRVLDNAINWFVLRGDEYVLVEPNADGVIESDQFPGLRLHIHSMIAGDAAAVLAALRAPGAPE